MTEEKPERNQKRNFTKTERTTRTPRPYHKRNTVSTKKAQNANIFKASKLKIIPLGGLHEVGKNITVFEYENEIIVVNS